MSIRLADRSFQYPVGIAKNMLVEVGKFTFPADFVILEMEEDKEYFDALLDEGSKILHSIEGTLLEEEIFAEFDEFMAMTADENSDSESDTEDPPFEKITINTDYKIKTSLEEPPTDLELKPLHDNLEYVFFEEPSFLPVIISSQLTKEKKNKLVSVQRKVVLQWSQTKMINLFQQEPLRVERLAGNKYYFLDGFSGYFQIPIDPNDQEKTTFTCPFGTYAYRRMLLPHSKGLEVDKAKIDVISKLPPHTNIKGVRSFFGHAGFYRRFIKDFSKIARSLTKLLEKHTPFEFDDECQKAFELLKEKLTCAPV
ncbi:hypothetical protein Tco_1535651, partial [Tanacetum coccineum]